MKYIQPFIKISLVLAVIGLSYYSYDAYLDIQKYQEVHDICSKAVKGFPSGKLQPLARSGQLTINSSANNLIMGNELCRCEISFINGQVNENKGTYCGDI